MATGGVSADDAFALPCRQFTAEKCQTRPACAGTSRSDIPCRRTRRARREGAGRPVMANRR
ncbi:hypothetical protein ACVH9Z_19460 [Rhodococcus opacus]|uniref:hypothetical protein n=1 Tax=Rhodococcus opacus TaxID=37919 RepID=UPI0031F5935F